jgi:nucleolar protein 14
MGKSGGSQLSQLKSALSQAGLSRQSQPKPGGNNSKKRKRGEANVTEADKQKKKAKLQAIHQKLNPFDVQVTKLKHDIPGQKVKGVKGRPGLSKQAGIEQVCTPPPSSSHC